MKRITNKEICKLISSKENCELKSTVDCSISSIENFNEFSGKGLTFYNGTKIELLKKHQSLKTGLIVASEKFKDQLSEGPFLLVAKPRMTFVYLANLLLKKNPSGKIHPSAIIDKEAEIGENTEIGANAVIGKCKIGKNCKIGAQAFISDSAVIKDDVIIFSNCVIGEPGLGSVVDYDSNQILFPHIGKVILNNNVVIGAGTHVNCGTLSDTVIGENTHVSTNCLVAHNCILGKNVYVGPGAALVGGEMKAGRRASGPPGPLDTPDPSS